MKTDLQIILNSTIKILIMVILGRQGLVINSYETYFKSDSIKYKTFGTRSGI